MSIGQEYTQYFEEQPTESQKAMWDLFVAEYVKDFHAVNALVRCGFNKAYAEVYAPAFLSYSYIQKRIMNVKEDDAAGYTTEQIKARVEATYIAAMESGDPKAAVAAARNLAMMRGVAEAPDKKGDEVEKLVKAFEKLATTLPD